MSRVSLTLWPDVRHATDLHIAKAAKRAEPVQALARDITVVRQAEPGEQLRSQKEGILSHVIL